MALCDFLESTISQTEGFAAWADVPLLRPEEEEDPVSPRQAQVSVDTIKEWIDQACAEDTPPRDSDVGKQKVDGLQKKGASKQKDFVAVTRWLQKVQSV